MGVGATFLTSKSFDKLYLERRVLVRAISREKHLLCALGPTVSQFYMGVPYIMLNRLIYVSNISLQYCPFKGGLKSCDRIR